MKDPVGRNVEYNPDEGCNNGTTDEFLAQAWKDVLGIMVRFHAEASSQIVENGRIIATHCLKKIVGSVPEHRQAIHRLALRLYGLWLIDPDQAKTWFDEWAEQEFDDDVPEAFPTYEGGWVSKM